MISVEALIMTWLPRSFTEGLYRCAQYAVLIATLSDHRADREVRRRYPRAVMALYQSFDIPHCALKSTVTEHTVSPSRILPALFPVSYSDL